MFTKRIIPCLDVNAGRVVKGINFVNLRDAGDPVSVAAAYDKAGADELVFLDITASSDARDYRVKGIPTIQYGPSNTVGIHSYNETVDIEDVKNAGQIYILSLCDLMGIE